LGNKVKEPKLPELEKTDYRRISWELYITVFIITLVIFGIGVFIGTSITKGIMSENDEKIMLLNDRIISLQLLLLSAEDKVLFCNLYWDVIDALEEETWAIGEQIKYIETEKGMSDRMLKVKYSDLEFRDYLLASYVSQNCDRKIHIILYFYSNDEKKCQKCSEQSKELFKVRKRLKSDVDIRIYNFDTDVDSGVINVLEQKYNISSYPSLVIDDEKYVGFMDSQKIIDIIKENSELTKAN